MMINDDGMSTVEYAIGLLAAAALGAMLYVVLSGDDVKEMIAHLVGRAFDVQF